MVGVKFSLIPVCIDTDKQQTLIHHPTTSFDRANFFFHSVFALFFYDLSRIYTLFYLAIQNLFLPKEQGKFPKNKGNCALVQLVYENWK